MSSYHTNTKTHNGKAINDDDPQYKGFTNNKSEEHKTFAHQHKKHSLTEMKHDVFIREMAQHGDRYIAYHAAYPAASRSSIRTSAARLLSKPGIASRIQEARLQAGIGLQAAMPRHYEDRLAGIEEKRAFLAGIISGKMESQVAITHNRKGTKTTVVKNAVRDILNAIALDARLEKKWNKIKAKRDLRPK